MTEGAASNIFVVKNGKLLAPPKDNLMLPGITYDVVLEIAAANHIPHEVRRIAAVEVFARTNCCSHQAPRKCSRSPHWMASRSAQANPAPCSPDCTGSIRISSAT